MEWKMSENSLFAVLLRSRWWISAAIAGGIILLGWALLGEATKWYGIFASLPFVVIASVAAWKQFKAPSSARVASTLEAVRAMSWTDFALALERGFRRDGYEVSRVAGPEADFEIAKAGRRSLVSGKRWKVARTGIEPLRGLQGAKDTREAHECVYVLAGELSDNARAFAAQKKIRLIDGPELARMLPEVGRTRRKQGANAARSRT